VAKDARKHVSFDVGRQRRLQFGARNIEFVSLLYFPAVSKKDTIIRLLRFSARVDVDVTRFRTARPGGSPENDSSAEKSESAPGSRTLR
jgi:hypothetical protein